MNDIKLLILNIKYSCMKNEEDSLNPGVDHTHKSTLSSPLFFFLRLPRLLAMRSSPPSVPSSSSNDTVLVRPLRDLGEDADFADLALSSL